MKKFVCAIFALLFLTIMNSEAYSCECAEVTQRQEFDNSQAVFIGKFIRTSESDGKVKFQVVKSWKGANRGEIISLVYWELVGCDYDLNLAKGKKYLIYAMPTRQGLFVSVDCGRSRSVNDAVDDINNMNKVAAGKKTAGAPSPAAAQQVIRPERE